MRKFTKNPALDEVSIHLFPANKHEQKLRIVVDGRELIITSIWVGVDGRVCIKRDNGTILTLIRGSEGY